MRERPTWQKERGPRHGNNRKWISRLKWLGRKRSRSRAKRNIEDNIQNYLMYLK